MEILEFLVFSAFSIPSFSPLYRGSKNLSRYFSLEIFEVKSLQLIFVGRLIKGPLLTQRLVASPLSLSSIIDLEESCPNSIFLPSLLNRFEGIERGYLDHISTNQYLL
jgi:hypothetical protein